MHRVSFFTGSAAAFLAVRFGASADDTSPPASPQPPPAQTPPPQPASPPSGKSKPTRKPHVHGPNGVTSLPEHRPIGWKMDVLDGPPFDLNACRGKVVFVNIFATWCASCRAEQPTVVAFARAHADDTIIVGMNYEELDDKVREYRKTFDIPYPIAMDRAGKILRGVYKGDHMMFPMTIVFRPDGTLSCAWAGDADRAWFERERHAALADLAP
jgi:thiol-disulfide isomerase/thioredoxin